MTSGMLTDTLRETLALFEEPGTPYATMEVADRLDLGRRSTYERLERLVEHGRLETKKVGASGRVWWQPSTGGGDDPADVPEWEAAAESMVDDVLDGAEVSVFVLDEDFRVAWINEATERYFGLDRDDVVGRDKPRLVEERIAGVVDDSASFANTVLATYEDNDRIEEFECRVTAGDGRENRWLEHRSKPIESGAYAGGRVELYYDVSDRKRSERARERDREQFESLIEAVEEYAIFVLDPEGRVRTWNPGAERIKDYAADDIVDEHVSTFYTGEDVDAGVPETNLATAAEDGSVEDEGWRVRADGSRFWANVTITAIRDENGELDGFAKVTRDMTERREYERQLEKQAEKRERQRDELELELERIFDRVSDGFYGLDDDLRFTYVNDHAEELLGLDGTGVVGRDIQSMLELTDGFEAAIEEALETQEPVTTENFYEPLDAWFQNTFYPSKSGLSVYFSEITERKKRERELELYETIVSAIDDGVYVLDDEFCFVRVNDAYVEMTGNDREDLLGTHCSMVIDDEVSAESAERVQEITAGDSDSATLEADIHRPDGTTLRAESNFTALPGDDRDNPRKVGVVRDVSERVERERELEESRRRYRTLVDNFPNGAVALVDEDLRYVTVGGAPVESVSASTDELEGELVDESLPAPLADIITPRYEVALDGEPSTFVDEVGDSIYEFRVIPARDADGEVFAALGMSQDVTERKRNERELRKRVQQQEVITALGQRALENRSLDDLLTNAAKLVAETLNNDYCKVLDLDREADELLLRQGVGWDEGIAGTATVSAVEDDSQAAYTLANEEPVVVENLESETRFSGPDLLTDHDVRSGISTIIGSPDDPWGILGTHDTEDEQFSDWDVSFVQSVANILMTAINRHEHEQELLHQREQLVAMNSLNEAVREITEAVIDQSTREEIETTVCEHLAATDSYSFAWIGDVDVGSQTVNLRTEAGVEGYLDGITITVEEGDEHNDGPTGKALRTGEIQTTQNIRIDDSYEPWRDHLEKYDVRASAAIPITHEDSVYGVLNVYTDRLSAFEGRERTVIAQLGEVVGHAIAATERKRALMSDEVVELEFHISNVFESIGSEDRTDGTISLDRAVPIEGEEFLVYGTATADAADSVTALVESIPYWNEVTFHEEVDGEITFELRLSRSPVLSALASAGGSVDAAVIEDGDYDMRLHTSPGTDVRKIIEVVKDAYPNAQLQRRRQFERQNPTTPSNSEGVLTDLTDRQQAAVQAAHHAGFFDWPREATGEDIAESLDVSPPTFHQHLRKAEKKVFDALLS